MFVINLVSARAVLEKIFASRVVNLGNFVRVIILHLVIVRRDNPRRAGVGGLQRFVGFIERVTISIIVERKNLFAVVFARAVAFGGDAAFVNVIAKMNDEIQVFADHVLVRGVKTRFVMLA